MGLSTRLATSATGWVGVWGLALALVLPMGVRAVDASAVPEAKRTPLGLYLNAREAAQMKHELGAGVLFVDVRSQAEAAFLGMAQAVDVLIPYQDFNGDSTGWDERHRTLTLDANLDFVPHIEAALKQRGLTRLSPIMVMCRSGARSAARVALLARHGFTQVYTVVDGFEGDLAKTGPQAGQRVVNGWRVEGLPWSYQLERSKLRP